MIGSGWGWIQWAGIIDVYKRQVMTSDTAAFARYFGWMLEKGIYVAPSQFEAMFVSAAHSAEMIDMTCDMVKEYGKSGMIL